MTQTLLTLAIDLALGVAFGFLHFRLLKRPNVGGLWAAMGVAFFGAVAGGFAFDWILCRLIDFLYLVLDGINWLMRNTDGRVLPPVNLVAAALGAFLLVYVLHKISPGRDDR